MGNALVVACLGLASGADGVSARLQNGSRPSAHLTHLERADFFLGKALFERTWASGRSSSTSSDGLGPLFNARSCAGCHQDGGRSNSIVHPEVGAPHLVLRVMAGAAPDPLLGDQLQQQASPGLTAEGAHHTSTVTSTFTYPDGEEVSLFRPHVVVTFSDSSSALAARDVEFAPRVAPQIWTASAIEAVPEEQIHAWADPEDRDGDGISGRVRWTFSLQTGERRAGRFGWKATAPTLEDQIANAFATDMGLSNRLILADQGECTPAQQPCLQAAAYVDDPQESYEVRDEVFDFVVGYSRGLATPDFAGDETAFAEGMALFRQTGCDGCHRSAYSIAEVAGAAVDAPPFTDLLLHDLGPGLADTRRQGSVAASEWRTAPLRGLGQTARSNPYAGYLHDGRALTIEQAILWHDGEARTPRDTFVGLPRVTRRKLLAFLQGL